MIIGCARVSTDGQSLEAQHAALTGASAEKVFAERVSGVQTVCVPKTSSVLFSRPNRLTSAPDVCAVRLLPRPILVAIQVEEPT
jgi:hypothetical protein